MAENLKKADRAPWYVKFWWSQFAQYTILPSTSDVIAATLSEYEEFS